MAGAVSHADHALDENEESCTAGEDDQDDKKSLHSENIGSRDQYGIRTKARMDGEAPAPPLDVCFGWKADLRRSSFASARR